jgi:hypothetical protein
MAPIWLLSVDAVNPASLAVILSSARILATVFLQVVFAPKRLIVLNFWVTEGCSAENRSQNFLTMSNFIG